MFGFTESRLSLVSSLNQAVQAAYEHHHYLVSLDKRRLKLGFSTWL